MAKGREMWKSNMNLHEVADLVERHLDKKWLYSQEWTDFVDTSQRDPTVNAYRKRCCELDPLVNSHAPDDDGGVRELREMIKALRELDISQMPLIEPPPRYGRYLIIGFASLVALALVLKHI